MAEPGVDSSLEPTSGMAVLQTVDRALRVLEFVAMTSVPVTAKTVSTELGLNLSTTYHLLSTLVSRGFLTHLENESAYAIGHSVHDVAEGFMRQIVPAVELRRIVGLCHEEAQSAAYFLIVRDAELVATYVSDCPDHRRATGVRPGVHEPVWTTGIGRLMLERTGGEIAPSGARPTRASLQKRLSSVPVGQLILCQDDPVRGTKWLKAPVADRAGRLLGVVAVSVPLKLWEDRYPRARMAVLRAAGRASTTMTRLQGDTPNPCLDDLGSLQHHRPVPEVSHGSSLRI